MSGAAAPPYHANTHPPRGALNGETPSELAAGMAAPRTANENCCSRAERRMPLRSYGYALRSHGPKQCSKTRGYANPSATYLPSFQKKRQTTVSKPSRRRFKP